MINLKEKAPEPEAPLCNDDKTPLAADGVLSWSKYDRYRCK
jgi:hypothetical protein